MGINSSVFSTPTNVMAMGHPFITPPYNTILGIPLGIDIRSRRLVYFDPWMLKNAGIINSAFGMILGPKNHGKSATLKIIAIRLMMLAAGYDMMRTAINDYKPEGKSSEYAQFSQVCGSTVFRIATMSVNPFEANLYKQRGNESYELGLLGTAETLCEFAKRSDLTGNENTALRVAVFVMLQQDELLWTPQVLFKLLRSISNSQIEDYFRTIDSKLKVGLEKRLDGIKSLENRELIEAKLTGIVSARDNHELADISAAADQVSTYLGDILTGSYGHMFGDSHSLYDMLTQRAITKDWRGVEPEAETLMRIIDTRIKVSAIENNRIDLLPHIELDDEKHKSMDNMVYARSHSYFSEIARGTHTCNLSATHRFDSIRKGGVGSELYGLGNTIINNLGFVLIGQQPDDPKILDEIQARYELSHEDTRALSALPRYTFGMKLGEAEPLRFIRVFATRMELAMLGTNSSTDRMIDRPDVLSEQHLARFGKQNALALIGMENDD